MADRYFFQNRNFKKAQFAVEFIIIMSVMFLIFLGVLGFVAQKFLDVKEDERKQIAQDLAVAIEYELDLARSVADGYDRTFTIPIRMNGNSYNISIINNKELVLTYVDQEYVLFLKDASYGGGNISPGQNRVVKREGMIYLNP